MVLSPPFTALGLHSLCLVSLHLLSLGLCVKCYGFPTVINKLAMWLVHYGESHSALETSLGASSDSLDLLCVLVRTGRYW
jgi:hypothetical protein